MVICAPQLLRYIEINLVNKIVKSNNPSFVPMRIEKTNDFIDLQYIPRTDVLVVMSKSNSLFIFKGLELTYQITDFDLAKGLDAQHVVIFDKADHNASEGPEDLSQHEEGLVPSAIEEHVPSDSLVPDEVKACSFKCSVMDAPLLEHLKSQAQFKKLAVGRKHIFVASKGGYLTIFLLDESLRTAPVHLKTAKLPEHIVSFKQLLLNSQETFLACVGKYPFQVREKLLPSGAGSSPSSRKKRKRAAAVLPRAGDENFTTRVIDLVGGGLTSVKGDDPGLVDKRLYDYDLKYDVLWISLPGVMDGNVMMLNRIYPHGVHDGAVLQLAGCKSKSSFASVADGKNVRVWAHTNEWMGEENFYMDEQPLCVDWHPLGLHMALGFATGLRVYIVRESRMLLAYNRGTKGTGAVRYNTSGNLLAAADSYYILLIDSLRYEVIRELAGHSSVISSLVWSPRLDYLFSVCKGNLLLAWNVPDLVQTEREEPLPITRYHLREGHILGVEYDCAMELVLVLTTSALLVLAAKNSALVYSLQFVSDSVAGPRPLFQLLSPALNLLLVAFRGGYFRVYYWPLNPSRDEYYEIYLDSESNVTGMLVTPCDRILAVGLENGSIFCLEVTKIVDGMQQQWAKTHMEWDKATKLRNYHGLGGFSSMDSTMVTSVNRVNALDKAVEDLRRGIYNEKTRILWRLQEKYEEYAQERVQLREKCEKELETYRETAESEQAERMERLRKLRQELVQVESLSKQEQEKITEGHTKLLMATDECNQEYDTELKKQKLEMKVELERLLQEHRLAISDVKTTQEDFIKVARVDIEKLIKDFEAVCAQREGVLKRQEEDHESELHRFEYRFRFSARVVASNTTICL